MSHFGIDLLMEKLPQNSRRRLEMIIPFSIGAIALTLIIEGIRLLKLTQFQGYTTMPFSHAWATAAMPVSGLLMILYLIRHKIKEWREKEGGLSG
jgi:TRAP-type C4-dicarboxylate transport system permease small subunit